MIVPASRLCYNRPETNTSEGTAMKKAIAFALLLALLLCTASPASAFTTQRSTQNLKIDGKSVECDKYNIDGYNYFKLRDLAALLNGTGSQFNVDWDASKRSVAVTTNSPYVTRSGNELEIGKDQSATAQRSPQTIVIDGAVRSDLTAYLIGGSNYFKLAERGRALGFDVAYDEATRTMAVSSRSAAASTRLGATEDAGRDYLNKIVFLGDSTTYGIGYYYGRGYTDLCPASQIWTPKSGTLTLSYYSIATVVYPPTGEEIPIAEAVKRAKPEILMITLGVNGVSFMDEEWFIRDYTALVKLVQENSPDTKIILNSIYPVAASYQHLNSINNTKIRAANGWIERIAADTGARFLYSFESVVGADGWLPESAHNGDGMHLSGETFTAVMQYIRTHAWL